MTAACGAHTRCETLALLCRNQLTTQRLAYATSPRNSVKMRACDTFSSLAHFFSRALFGSRSSAENFFTNVAKAFAMHDEHRLRRRCRRYAADQAQSRLARHRDRDAVERSQRARRSRLDRR